MSICKLEISMPHEQRLSAKHLPAACVKVNGGYDTIRYARMIDFICSKSLPHKTEQKV